MLKVNENAFSVLRSRLASFAQALTIAVQNAPMPVGIEFSRGRGLDGPSVADAVPSGTYTVSTSIPRPSYIPGISCQIVHATTVKNVDVETKVTNHQLTSFIN